jgi:hypothetical protein
MVRYEAISIIISYKLHYVKGDTFLFSGDFSHLLRKYYNFV